ncbi:hypothetical protein BDF19DRAFT_438251 [Syncephalis fuscata]|nr:hypothetical protein BDF19DRAFT_438251 [Syncephalis fuscata]
MKAFIIGALAVAILVADVKAAMDINKMLCLNGRKPLALSPCLVKSSEGHSQEMARRRQMSHSLSGEPEMGSRIRSACYGERVSGSAENIAMGQRSEEAVMTSWLKSPGHYKNLMGDYTHFGAAMVTAGNSPYWTQNFGKGLKGGSTPNCSGGSYSGSSGDDTSYDGSSGEDTHTSNERGSGRKGGAGKRGNKYNGNEDGGSGSGEMSSGGGSEQSTGTGGKYNGRRKSTGKSGNTMGRGSRGSSDSGGGYDDDSQSNGDSSSGDNGGRQRGGGRSNGRQQGQTRMNGNSNKNGGRSGRTEMQYD